MRRGCMAGLLLTPLLSARTSPTVPNTGVPAPVSGGPSVSFYLLVCSSCRRACVIFLFQGTNASALEKDIGPEQFPINEHYFGLVNVSI